MALAPRLPNACTDASSPNAEPRMLSGARVGDGGVLGSFGAPNAHAGDGEREREQRDARAADGESEVGEQERGDAGREHATRAASVADVPGWDADDGRGEVVDGVQHKRDLDGAAVAVGGGEQFGRAQDQKRRGDVAQLERCRRRRTAGRADLRSTGRMRMRSGRRSRVASSARVPDRVHDRKRREQARDDRYQDRGANADDRDEREREQRAEDRAEVVHRPLEPVRAAVDARRHDVG